ncbi:hypothetical protein [Streptomyces ipomoeae]|uniref:hypothetical protein n=1 Tax=Streptomyces ipomoeae TaxID=103232 RepID=UPI00215CA5A7|nr:hypothetical protein [Streptomyces ipomoeae]
MVEFDAAIRAGNARANADGKRLLGQAFLHRSRVPLDQAPIDHVTAREWAQRQADLDEATADVELALEQGAAEGCSPWSCRSGAPVADDFDVAA